MIDGPVEPIHLITVAYSSTVNYNLSKKDSLFTPA